MHTSRLKNLVSPSIPPFHPLHIPSHSLPIHPSIPSSFHSHPSHLIHPSIYIIYLLTILPSQTSILSSAISPVHHPSVHTLSIHSPFHHIKSIPFHPYLIPFINPSIYCHTMHLLPCLYCYILCIYSHMLIYIYPYFSQVALRQSRSTHTVVETAIASLTSLE